MTRRVALAAACLALLLDASAASAARTGGGRSGLTTGRITTNGTIIGQKLVVTDGFGSRSIVIAPVPTHQAIQNQFFGPAAGSVIATTGDAFFVRGASTVTRFNNTGFVGEVVPVATIDGRRLGGSTAFGGGTLLDGSGGWGWGSYTPVVINLPSGPTLVAAQAAAPPPPPAKTQVIQIGRTAAESKVLTPTNGVLFLQGR